MKKMKKGLRTFCAIFLSIAMFAGCFDGIAIGGYSLQTVTKAEAASYDTLVSNFINDSRWRNGASWGNRGPAESAYPSGSCCAYVADFIYKVYGIRRPAQLSTMAIGSTNPQDIRSGDIIHTTNGAGHWFVVLYRNGNQLVTAEGNSTWRYECGDCAPSVRVGNNYWGIEGNSLKALAYRNKPTQNIGYIVRVGNGSYGGGTAVARGSYSSSSVTFTNDNNAGLRGVISNPACATVSQVGAKIWDNNGTLVVDHREDCGLRYSTITQNLNVVAEAKPSGLKPGTNYSYQLWANIGGNVVYSNKGQFRTTGTSNYTITNNAATNITNTNAVISGNMSPAGTASSWGFYIGTDASNLSKVTVSAGNTGSNNLSCFAGNYYTLKHGTRYFYKIWANVNGKEWKAAATNSFTTTSNKPDIPNVSVAKDSQNIGIDGTVSISWNKVSQASYYIAYIYNSSGNLIQESSHITGTTFAFDALKEAGSYQVSVEAYNEVGTKGKSQDAFVTVHPDVTVKFVDADSFVDAGEDYEPATLSEQTIHYGANAAKPADPVHQGYTFSGWSASGQTVKEDTTIKATYKINSYTVTYKNAVTSEKMGTETVSYYSAATPVDYEVPDGYVKTGFNGWDKDYTHITEDVTLYTSYGWYNDAFPVYASITSAIREYDAASEGDEGYTVTVKLKNGTAKTAKGRAVVALKTKEGKLLTSTESSAFNIKASAEKELEIFVPYENAATKAEVYVVGQYKDAVPISNHVETEIDQTNAKTSWSTENPGDDVSGKETRVEYRYQTKSTTTSRSTSLAGYTQDGGSWVKSGSGTIDYVAYWPSGFNTSSGQYYTYHKTPRTAYETATSKTTVSTSTVGYLYWHYCRNASSGPSGRLVSDCYEYPYTTWHCFQTSSPIAFNGSAGAFYSSQSGLCKDSWWWQACYANQSSQLPILRCSYTDYYKLFNYYKWSDWSEWSTTPVTETATRKVEKRTVYRYQPENTMDEDNSGKTRTVSGKVDTSFAGKEATLFIYKVGEASDYTNEYISQTTIGEDGSYSFQFKLREEPSAETGDFTVALGIEGNTTPIYLDEIEAPKETHTVRFYDYDGKLISKENVTDGQNAPLPAESKLKREGYTFKNWSASNLNITEDKDIVAEYEINTYHVVFVDWKANSVSVEKFQYGSQLVAPQAEDPGDGLNVEWDAVADGDTIVTKDRIVTTRYTKKSCNVTIKGYDNEVLQDENVKYGDALTLPDMEEDGKIFLGWKNENSEDKEELTDTIVTDNMILCPVYVYDETVEDPTADIKTGSYDKVQTVTLSTKTPGATIFYTLDGSDPREYGAQEYTGPITIDDAATLQFVASKAGMNDSQVQSRLYAVNYDGANSKWMTYEELPQEVQDDFENYKVVSETGYRYKETKKTSLLSEISSLEAGGWKLQSDDSYSDYSAWSDTMPTDIDQYYGAQVEEKPVYDTTDAYVYSHYVTTDGTATVYSPVESDGASYEETEAFAKKLQVAGTVLVTEPETGTEVRKPYYIYDGQRWFNQTTKTTQVQTGTQYRCRYKVATYYKWGDYTIEKPSSDETREYTTTDVYSYTRHNTYLVTLHTDVETIGDEISFFIKEGQTVDLSDYTDEIGYEFDGAYTDADYKNAWSSGSDQVTKSMDLYLKYTGEEFEVQFLGKDGTELEKQTVAYKKAATPPEAPKVDGYVFVGWDTDAYKSVTGNVCATAKYVAKEDYATVELDNTSMNLFKGKSAELTAIITPSSHDPEDITWHSEDESIASVSASGKVTAVSAGMTNIIATVGETGETATCQVTVKTDANQELSLIKNDKLSVDAHGYLRGVKAGVEGISKVSEVLSYFENAKVRIVTADGTVLEEDANVGTGYKVQLLKNNEVIDEMEIVVTGDFKADGTVDNKDVSLLLQYLMNKTTPTNAQILAADVNGDGKVNNKDAILIARSLVGKAQL